MTPASASASEDGRAAAASEDGTGGWVWQGQADKENEFSSPLTTLHFYNFRTRTRMDNDSLLLSTFNSVRPGSFKSFV